MAKTGQCQWRCRMCRKLLVVTCTAFCQPKVDTKIKMHQMIAWIKTQLLRRLLWGRSDSVSVAENISFPSKLSEKRQQPNIESSGFKMCSIELSINYLQDTRILLVHCFDPNLCLHLCPTNHSFTVNQFQLNETCWKTVMMGTD